MDSPTAAAALPDASMLSLSSSELSSAHPSRCTSPASSDLSELSRSPSPPAGFRRTSSRPSKPSAKRRRSSTLESIPYPSPPSSQQNSQSGSPAPDTVDVSIQQPKKDCPPPAKRRRVSKEKDGNRDPMAGLDDRAPKYIDIQGGEIESGQEDQLATLLKVLHKRQKIVVIAGAGISVSAGIPDFRSKNGIFKTLKAEHKLKGSGKDMFDASVYRDRDSTTVFQAMVKDMSRLTKSAKPTAFHHMLATIASEGRLLRLYSQNVDSIDTSLDPLATRIPLTKDDSGKWPRTVQLHGSLAKAVCSKCNALSDFDAGLFDSSDPPVCGECVEVNHIRTTFEGKRSHGIGRLRPRMVLYNEHNPDDEAIGAVTREDLRRRPDAVVVVGTTLKVPGVKRIVREMCGVVRDRKGGVAVWISNDPPPAQKEFEDCWDIVVQGSCDEIAHKAAMRRWDDPIHPREHVQTSDDDLREAQRHAGEVHVQLPVIAHAQPVDLPSDLHYNNSFKLASLLETPKKSHDRPSPEWTPMTSRRSSVVPSIEAEETDNITVHSGLLTPTKSKQGSPSSQDGAASRKAVGSINDRLKDAGKANPATSKRSKGGRGKGTNKKSNSSALKKGATTKVVNPASFAKSIRSSQPKKNAKSISFQSPARGPIDLTFTQGKSWLLLPDEPEGKDTVALAKCNTPSKLRTVLNASPSETPLEPLSPQDARSNCSPPKQTEYILPSIVYPRVFMENPATGSQVKT
ncbi:DHS-like NAD/FAD-binding domain-containing protein [Polychaeton citri CBS 116435]|uniref:DHS-like NAD/FAD-binding domain-containing protein n=1 Tax=Polychaeton citri CBS 116435 TaxID=1314669 RepID=A0A9P4QB43_9PEZI|nr:DHS-like NAD/FAD-binding domain-containing protein [Polychaeton citri CBS 116435]